MLSYLRSEIGRSKRESDRRFRYSSPWVSAVRGLPLNSGVSHRRVVTAAMTRPGPVAALLVLILGIRREYVVLSESRTGQALDEYFKERLFGIPRNRLSRGVLILPRDHAEYLRGRRRQALRTNLRRAAAAGILCEEVTDSRCAAEDVSQLLRRYCGAEAETETEWQVRMADVRTLLERPETTVTVARDRNGRPLAVVVAIIDQTVCLIDLAVSTCRDASWALHDHLVRILIARRVKYLLASGGGLFGALGLNKNVQHYQHLLGYELRHVIPAAARPAMRRRRRLVSLVVVAAAAALAVPPIAESAQLHRSVQALGMTASIRCGPGSAMASSSAPVSCSPVSTRRDETPSPLPSSTKSRSGLPNSS